MKKIILILVTLFIISCTSSKQIVNQYHNEIELEPFNIMEIVQKDIDEAFPPDSVMLANKTKSEQKGLNLQHH